MFLRVVALALVLLGTSPASPQVKRTRRTPTTKIVPDEPVDLNEASESELKAVPGITARTAKKIVEGRPYSSVAELANAGLSSATIKRIQKNVTVGGSNKPQSGAALGMVWVIPGSKVYHLPGDRWFGKTKTGSYMKERDAIAAGYQRSK